MKKHQKVLRADAALVIQKRNSSRRNSPRWRKALAWAVTAWTLGMAPTAYALGGGAYPILDAAGAGVTVTGTENMSITANLNSNNLIKWVEFSIGEHNSVTFDANNYLNYVTGHARSDILGTLTGGGHIYLVNPNGILIGDNAVINVGNLHLSTRTLTDAQLAAFTPNGESPLPGTIGGDVINMGQLNANTITVEGNNITFKNTADVTKGGAIGADGKITGGTAHNDSAVTLTAKSKGEIHIGSADASTPGYTMSGTDNKYMLMYKLISTADELQAINTDRNTRKGYYMLANDVDMKDFGNFTPIAPGDGDGYFTGRFDGLNHQIQNLTINSGAENVGLFGHVLGPGVIENVGLVGGSVTGTGTSCQYVGGIVGYNTGGTIRNVYHTGTVIGTKYVGGIVGYNVNDYGTVVYYGTVEHAYNTGDVTETNLSAEVGGIAGHSIGVIREVFNTGTVSGTGNTSMVGGIVGNMSNSAASVENAYNTGAITGAFYVGGIAGSFQGHLTNVYNTGTVTGTSTSTNMKVGSLVGNENGFLTNAYSISGVASALTETDLTANDTNVAELSETEMKAREKFAGFDFTESGPWRIYEGKTTPFLAAFPIPEPADPDPGTNPGTDPSNPGTTDPTNPGTTDPTTPGTTDPTNPGTTDPTNPLNPKNPASAGDPTPQPEQKPQDIIKNVTENRGAAQEYTNVVGSINSGASTAMPTSGGTPVLNAPEAPTQNAAPTTGATGETQGAAAQERSGGEAQQPNGNPPQQQTTGGQIAAGKQETQLGITYTDINMPESMSVEALATSLNGGATQQGNAEAATNGPATEPTATMGGNMPGASEEDEA